MARSSLYSKFLEPVGLDMNIAIPNWMTGEDFGDQERQAAALEQARNQAELGDQNISFNNTKIDAARRQAAFENDLASQFDGTETLRDAYAKAAGIAAKNGQAEQMIQFQEAIDKQEEQDRAKKIQAYSMIPQLGYRSPQALEQVLSLGGVDPSQIMDAGFADRNSPIISTKGGKYRIDPETGQPELLIGNPAGKEKEPKRPTQIPMYSNGGRVILVDKTNEAIQEAQDQGYNYKAPGKPSAADDFNAMLNGGSATPKVAEAPTQEQKKSVVDITKIVPPRKARPGFKWRANQETGELVEVPL